MKVKFSIVLLLLCSYSYGQLEEYRYRREIQGITEKWHKVILPNEIFGKVSPNLSDIRIVGITSRNDTIEAPYLFQMAVEDTTSREVNVRVFNQSHNEQGSYYSFEADAEKEINQMNLNFKQQNFDWRLSLEGSQNQLQWFSIVDDYRIISVKNQLTDYKFTTVRFPVSRYRCYRILIKGKEAPKLISAKFEFNKIIHGSSRDYKILNTNLVEDKQNNQTVMDIDLDRPVPVSMLKIDVKDTYDYYRPIVIQYLSDSVRTENGWRSNYRTLYSGHLSSFDKSEFKFRSTILNRMKVIIYNHDNNPLAISTPKVRGYLHELLVRFTKPANYYLVYGNSEARKPDYDLGRFTRKIPLHLATLKLGAEQEIKQRKLSEEAPLFVNKNWLWAIMALIICILGWFSVKMIRSH